METSYLKTLELDKIIARAAEGCVCREAKAQMLALEPQCDPDEVRYSLEQTDAINSLLIKNGSPRFGGGKDSAGSHTVGRSRSEELPIDNSYTFIYNEAEDCKKNPHHT